jgi:hypothetical protein
LQKTKEGKEMKVVVRLAILLATLLLVTNMSFANGICDKPICYDIIGTDENGNTNTDFWEVCLNDDGIGLLLSDKTGTYELYLFGGGPGWFNTSGGPGFVTQAGARALQTEIPTIPHG